MTFLIALSAIALNFSSPMFMGLFFAIWLAPIVKNIKIMMPQVKLPIFICAYCMASVSWSDHSGITARAAIEFLCMVGCIVFISKHVSFQAFITGVCIGTACTLLYVLSTSRMMEGEALTAFGSKNQVGHIAEICIVSCIFCFFVKRKILITILPIAIFCLYLSKSATSIVSIAPALAVACGAFGINKIPKGMRAAVMFSGIFTALLAMGAISLIDWQAIGLSFVGKDATLTGRTYLWNEGLKAASYNPILGTGYKAFWVPGNIEAEKLWYEFGIQNRSGFHFHNMFINSYVEQGIIGLILWVFLYVSALIKGVLNILKSASAESIFYLTIICIYAIRAFTEVDIMGPFGFGTFLFFFAYLKLNSFNIAGRKNRPRSPPLLKKTYAFSPVRGTTGNISARTPRKQ